MEHIQSAAFCVRKCALCITAIVKGPALTNSNEKNRKERISGKMITSKHVVSSVSNTHGEYGHPRSMMTVNDVCVCFKWNAIWCLSALYAVTFMCNLCFLLFC